MKKETDWRSAPRSQTDVHTSSHPFATKEQKTEANENCHRRTCRSRLDEQVALRNRSNEALVMMLVRIRVKKMMKLFGSGQPEQPKPKAEHQDANGNPAETANPRCVS